MGTVKLLIKVTAFGILPFFAASNAHAEVKDLGDVCISFFYDLELGIPPQIDRFGVLAYGANQQHILLTGAFNPAHGSALVTGNKVLVTLHSSFVSLDSFIKGSATTHMVLSASTLSGTLTTIITRTSPTQVTETSTGQVTVIPCP